MAKLSLKRKLSFLDLSVNRLILIGNGFDLAHGLKTDYNSFILWYLYKCFDQASRSFNYDDDLISITVEADFDYLPIQFDSTKEFVDYFYKKGFLQLKDSNLLFGSMPTNYPNPFVIIFKSPFFEQIITNCYESQWVNIENEFYEQLKSCYTYNRPDTRAISELNNSLKFIIKQLVLYLTEIKCEKVTHEYSDILTSEIVIRDIILSNKDKLLHNLNDNQLPYQTVVLNFNYTSTAGQYLKKHDNLPIIENDIEINHIHGEINTKNNPLIFGFGDELDDDYKKMELSKVNGFFEYIKSFWYFKTSNYLDLIRFIESDMYQIYVLGHSCGLSDRTLLNMLFEHTNCKSIKIYYYEHENGNNFTHLTQEISRHFKDKVSMRNKIVPFDRSEPMPQVK